MHPVTILTCKTLNHNDPDNSGWYRPEVWRPGKYHCYEYNEHLGRDVPVPDYRRYFVIPIGQPVRIPLAKKQWGSYYYTMSWTPYEDQYLTYPLFEIQELKNRSQIAITKLRTVRGSEITTVWQEMYYRGRIRGIPPHLRNAEQIHYARIRREATANNKT